ncbi:hypothetical protein A5724_06575 [Mycobacterium sp. ACS1612]|nr:hypothetical protein A5724_06575 [Mycobacterium sp. ACS1612]
MPNCIINGQDQSPSSPNALGAKVEEPSGQVSTHQLAFTTGGQQLNRSTVAWSAVDDGDESTGGPRYCEVN